MRLDLHEKARLTLRGARGKQFYMRMPEEAMIGATAIVGTLTYTVGSIFLAPYSTVDERLNQFMIPFACAVAVLFLLPALFLYARSKVARGWLSITFLFGAAMMVYSGQAYPQSVLLLTVAQVIGVALLWFPRARAWFNGQEAEPVEA